MRDTGPIGKSLDQSGNTEVAATYMGAARTVLGQLVNQMALGNLTVGARTATLPDGTIIRAFVAGGMKRVFISSPVAPTLGTTQETPELSQETPELSTQLVLQPLAVFNGILEPDSDNGGLFRPMYLDDILLTVPDSKPRVLPARGTPTTRYRNALAGGGNLPLARIDAMTAQPLPLSQQPYTFKITASTGMVLDPSSIVAPRDVHAANMKTAPANLGYFQVPSLAVDTVLTIEGKSSAANIEVAGVLLVERSLQFGATAPTFSSSSSSGDSSFSTVSMNGTGVPYGSMLIYPCPNAMNYVCSYSPVPEFSSAPALGMSFGLYLMTADPAYENVVTASARFGYQTGNTPDGLIGANTVLCTWSQTGGNLTMHTDTNGSGQNRLSTLSPVTNYGNYSASGVLVCVDGAGNQVTVPVSISLDYIDPHA